jgi:tetratricopeptide (TPR) repeat protein
MKRRARLVIRLLRPLGLGVFLAALLLPAPLPARAASGEWQELNALYSTGKFAEALAELQSHPGSSAEYYYNLGTVLERLGRLGHALAYLEKANRLRPHDSAIQHNLQLARNALGQALGPGRLDPASTWSEEVADRVSIEEIRGILGLVGSILALLWLRSYVRTRRLRKTLLHPAALIAAVGFSITCGLYVIERMAASRPPAVCLERETVRSGPGDHFLELAQVDAGMKLRVMGEPVSGEANPTGAAGTGLMQGATAQWRQVRFSQDGIGWVRDSSLLLL